MPILYLCQCGATIPKPGRCRDCERQRNLEPARQIRRNTISPSQRYRVYARDGFRCVYCGQTEDLTLDHLTPLAERVHVASDEELVTACRSCNSRRGRGVTPSRALSFADPAPAFVHTQSEWRPLVG